MTMEWRGHFFAMNHPKWLWKPGTPIVLLYSVDVVAWSIKDSNDGDSSPEKFDFGDSPLRAEWKVLQDACKRWNVLTDWERYGMFQKCEERKPNVGWKATLERDHGGWQFWCRSRCEYYSTFQKPLHSSTWCNEQESMSVGCQTLNQLPFLKSTWSKTEGALHSLSGRRWFPVRGSRLWNAYG